MGGKSSKEERPDGRGESFGDEGGQELISDETRAQAETASRNASHDKAGRAIDTAAYRTAYTLINKLGEKLNFSLKPEDINHFRDPFENFDPSTANPKIAPAVWDKMSPEDKTKAMLKDENFQEAIREYLKDKDEKMHDNVGKMFEEMFGGTLDNIMPKDRTKWTDAQEANYKAEVENVRKLAKDFRDKLKQYNPKGKETFAEALGSDLDKLAKEQDKLKEIYETMIDETANHEGTEAIGPTAWDEWKAAAKRWGLLAALGLLGLIFYGFWYDMMFTRCKYIAKSKAYPLPKKGEDGFPDHPGYMINTGAACSCNSSITNEQTCTKSILPSNVTDAAWYPYCMPKPITTMGGAIQLTNDNKFCKGNMSDDDGYVGYAFYNCSFPRGILKIPIDVTDPFKFPFGPGDCGIICTIKKYTKYAIIAVIIIVAVMGLKFLKDLF